MRSPSLTLRLTLIFTLLVAFACGVTGVSLYRSLSAELLWRDDQTLLNRASQLRQLLTDGAEPRQLPLYFNRMLDTRQDLLMIKRAEGETLVNINQAGVALPTLAPVPPGHGVNEQALHRWQRPDGVYVSALALTASDARGPLIITVARVAQERAQMLAQYRRESLMVCLLATLAAALLSPWLIRRGLRAIARLSEATARTGSETLQQPLSLETLPRELLPLGEALNTMRHRLAEDFARLTRFADDLAHELRTPVNILLGQNQVALQRPRSVQEYQSLLTGNIEELEQMTRLIENILFLARADHQNIALKRERLALEPFIHQLTDFLEPLAEEQEITFNVQAQGDIFADRLLLQRALTNLLTNALRHAPAGSEVRITAVQEAGETVLSVANQGAPIAEAEKLFQRFWRGDNARHTPGTGLGLALTEAIARLHGGYTAVDHEAGWNRFRLRFPAA
ncbi:heavy metal sensor histidine kinase [Cronobacter sakazakii]|uniref:heavy metal sensor histidine kinase n=1 Tax=Cronobacter sakazakii TaxID=28141 RepID=UPI001C0DFFEE|nr:heavy metal sensor histidine kinase [Cronobacter sakazakii]ELY2810217.1 heavy metal sensor histidine kinase [Cronobacter sakazakii]ELY5888468.1 heavy metal sensor histidine kinase [Cronobacter sakazakii]ELY6220818.1 heavy metal sensor histidine kinase [Cronobacter sakazakii]QWR95037.1 heavy metal sensor histidine kinase [Cronobacter sakazakii]